MITIKADEILRSVRSIEGNIFDQFFINGDDGSHFALFINGKYDISKLKCVGLNLEGYIPLDSAEKSDNFVEVLKIKIINKKITVTYKENPRGKSISKIEFATE